MADDQQGTIHSATPAAVSGTHPASDPPQLLVGPATGAEFNTATLRIIPIACWKVEDILFAFDSSFVTPDIATEIKQLQSLRDLHKDTASGKFPPLSLFGHADPVGPAVNPDGYNKALSGRRATAIYAVLIVNSDPDTAVGLWNTISTTEHWGASQKQIMKSNVPDGTADGDLLKTYMQSLCPSDFQLTAQDFLAQGAGDDGKGDYQGCSSFNPILIFSQTSETRFEQTSQHSARNVANAPNRRVMALLFRPGSQVDPAKWPCPNAKGDKSGCIQRFWKDGDDRRHRRLPDADRKFDDTHDTFACRFYQRLLTGSPCEKNVPVVPAVLEIVLDSDNNFAVDAAEPVATFVRVGIWDHAFDTTSGTLLNTSTESKNFIGSDSKGPLARRFYFRVHDLNAAGRKEIQVNWRTEFGDASGGTDDAPGDQSITLTPTADPSVFVSHAVFLVTEEVDHGQATDSGLATGPDRGSRTLDQSNHRLRLITVDDTHLLDSKVVAEYTPPAGGTMVSASVPVFQRSPDERLKINVHLVNLRDSAGGTPVLTPARKQLAVDSIRSVYARIGIYTNIDEIVIDPPASCINWQAQYPGSPLAILADPAVESSAFDGTFVTPSKSEADVINLIRARPDFEINDIYLVYVTKIWHNPAPKPSKTAVLTIGPGGESFPEFAIKATSIAKSFAFVGVQTVNQMADPHEMTHVTTNFAHFDLGAAGATGPGPVDGRNLMQRFALIFNRAPADSKRLWDDDFTNNNLSPPKIPAQITAIRKSRFARPL